VKKNQNMKQSIRQTKNQSNKYTFKNETIEQSIMHISQSTKQLITQAIKQTINQTIKPSNKQSVK
jgi:hypothetical protein